MNKSEFAEYCRGQIVKSYQNTKAGTPDDTLKHRTEGLFQAAKLLGAMTADEIKEIIEVEHQNVFGETVEERMVRKKSLADLKESSPDEFYEIPAIQRNI